MAPLYLQSLMLFLLEIRLKSLEAGAAFVVLQWGALVYPAVSYQGLGAVQDGCGQPR